MGLWPIDVNINADINRFAEQAAHALSATAEEAYKIFALLFPGVPVQLAARRAKCLVDQCRAVQKTLEDAGVPIDQRRQISDKLGILWWQNAALEDEHSLQQLWINLLANAQNPNFDENMLLPAFTSIIKDLSPMDAMILKKFQEVLLEQDLWYHQPTASEYSFVDLEALFDPDAEDYSWSASFDNLIRLRLIEKIPASGWDGHVGFGPPHLTILGIQFLMACVAENLPETKSKRPEFDKPISPPSEE